MDRKSDPAVFLLWREASRFPVWVWLVASGCLGAKTGTSSGAGGREVPHFVLVAASTGGWSGDRRMSSVRWAVRCCAEETTISSRARKFGAWAKARPCPMHRSEGHVPPPPCLLGSARNSRSCPPPVPTPPSTSHSQLHPTPWPVGSPLLQRLRQSPHSPPPCYGTGYHDRSGRAK